jgi:hypothetical protein
MSTLHTNDAAGAVIRVLDMGVDPYLITSSVECVIAQRLVRLLCPACKEQIPSKRPDLEYVYRSKDYLLAAKERIERALFERLRNLFSVNVRLTFYDMTSTYFHPHSGEWAAYGWSRDHRPDKEQVVIGVVTSYEGYPLKH